METSPNIGTLATALAEFRLHVPPIPKTHKATIPGKDGKSGYSYMYADLADMQAACTPPLSNNGLAVMQSVASDGSSVAVQSMLMHSSGEWILSDVLMMPSGATPQTAGSAISYARRYQYGPLLGVTSEEDDDGAAATHSADAEPMERKAKRDADGGSAKRASEKQVAAVFGKAKALSWDDEYLLGTVKRSFKVDHPGDLTPAACSKLLDFLEEKVKAKADSEGSGESIPADEGYTPPADDADEIPF